MIPIINNKKNNKFIFAALLISASFGLVGCSASDIPVIGMLMPDTSAVASYENTDESQSVNVSETESTNTAEYESSNAPDFESANSGEAESMNPAKIENVNEKDIKKEETKTENTESENKVLEENVSVTYDGFEGHLEQGGFVIDYCFRDDEELIVPDSVYGYPVTRIGRLAFARKTSETIRIPDTVTDIGERAFTSCELAQNIILGSGIKNVEKWAFSYCHALQDITFPEGTQHIADAVFFDSGVKEVRIPESVKDVNTPVNLGNCPNAVIIRTKPEQQ